MTPILDLDRNQNGNAGLSVLALQNEGEMVEGAEILLVCDFAMWCQYLKYCWAKNTGTTYIVSTNKTRKNYQKRETQAALVEEDDRKSNCEKCQNRHNCSKSCFKSIVKSK